MAGRKLRAGLLLLAAAAGVFAIGCGGNSSEPQRLILEGCAHWEQGHLWCAARVFDTDHTPVIGLGVNAFSMTEAIPGQDPRVVGFDSKEREFEDPGFYERSVTADKIDIISAIDISMTMEDFVASLKPELKKLLDALYQKRADFRLGFIQYDNLFDEVVVEPLRGPMDQAKLRKFIDDLTVRGEWWTPAATFDALLLAGDGASQGLGFREDAQKVVVAVSDSFAASAYGLEWYSIWCTNANQSAVGQIQKARPYRLLDNCDNEQLAANIIDLVKELVYANWDNDSGALKKVVLKIAAIFLDLVLDPAVNAIEDDLKDELRDALGEAGAEYSDEVVALVRVGLEAIWGGIQTLLDDSQETSFLNAAKARVQVAIQKLGDPKNVKKAVSAVIDILKQKSGPGMMREFVLPLLDMILRTAVDVDGGKVDHDIVVEVLARLFCNYVLIERYFSTPLQDGMRALWAQAKGFAPSGTALERYDAMHQDFRAYRRDVVESNVDLALAAMAVQETFEQIDMWLSGAEYLLYNAEYLTAATCVKYPDFCETAFEDVPNLVKFIRGLRIMTNIVEFALKLDGANKIAHATANGNPVLWATP